MTTETQIRPDDTDDGLKRGGPGAARPIFSTADFALLRTAVLTHLRTIEDDPSSVQYSNLYHRLGRLG
jgi:predicted Zn-dependent peptidase